MVRLWTRQPQLAHLRPTYPGATIATTAFSRDGRLALVIALPSGGREAWLLDASTGSLRRIGPAGQGAALTVAPDGAQVAYLAASTVGVPAANPGPTLAGSSPTTRLDEVWVAAAERESAPRLALRLPPGGERLVDLSWSPDGQHLLLVTRQTLTLGGEQTRLLWLPLGDVEPRELLTLPGQVVPGSYTWEPGVRAVAFLARPGTGPQTAATQRPKCGRAVAIDSTVLQIRGGVWHAKHRAAGVVPHTSIDTEAHWTKRGWHGWVYGWKLHLVSTVASVWIPLAAELTPANAADNELAPSLLADLPETVRVVLGDLHYNAPNVRAVCQRDRRVLVTPGYGPYPHTDDGVAVRRLFHKLCSANLETFNELFKSIFDVHGAVPSKGRRATRRFALGALFVYQLMLLARFEAGLDLRIGLKAFLKAA